jgi:hypothetical protein
MRSFTPCGGTSLSVLLPPSGVIGLSFLQNNIKAKTHYGLVVKGLKIAIALTCRVQSHTIITDI